jgi:hypothetical protein
MEEDTGSFGAGCGVVGELSLVLGGYERIEKG